MAHFSNLEAVTISATQTQHTGALTANASHLVATKQSDGTYLLSFSNNSGSGDMHIGTYKGAGADWFTGQNTQKHDFVKSAIGTATADNVGLQNLRGQTFWVQKNDWLANVDVGGTNTDYASGGFLHDADDDGDKDLIVGKGGGRIEVYLNDGSGGFTKARLSGNYTPPDFYNIKTEEFSTPTLANVWGNATSPAELVSGQKDGTLRVFTKITIANNATITGAQTGGMAICQSR